MSTGLAITGATPAQFRPNWDSVQTDVNIPGATVVRVLQGDPNRVGLIMQSVSTTVLHVRFRSLVLSQAAFELAPGLNPVVLDFSTLGPIIGDPLFAWASGAAGRIMLLTASDRGPGRV